MNQTKGTKTKADLARELTQLRDNVLFMMQQLQQRDEIVGKVLNHYAGSMAVEKVDEGEFTDEELMARFEPFVGNFALEKTSNKVFELIPLVAGWNVTNIKEPQDTKDTAVYTFTKGEEVIQIPSLNNLQAWAELRKKLVARKKEETVNG